MAKSVWPLILFALPLYHRWDIWQSDKKRAGTWECSVCFYIKACYSYYTWCSGHIWMENSKITISLSYIMAFTKKNKKNKVIHAWHSCSPECSLIPSTWKQLARVKWFWPVLNCNTMNTKLSVSAKWPKCQSFLPLHNSLLARFPGVTDLIFSFLSHQQTIT